MRALELKIVRDFWRIRGQALAIAMVLAAGIATLVSSDSVYLSLERTRAAYYDEGRFADVFAQARRAPASAAFAISSVPGVAAVDTRIVAGALLELSRGVEPGAALLISIPPYGAPRLNRPSALVGRLPEPDRLNEAMVNQAFAKANHVSLGQVFKVVMNGRSRSLVVVGVGQSPEYIYAAPPGAFIPDDSRFAVFWMPQRTLEAAFDLRGGFNSVSVSLTPGTHVQDVIERLDAILAPYGGAGAYARRDQVSASYLASELQQLRGMELILPPIFLLVAAFLIGVSLGRIVTLDREQIGLLRALGYSPLTVASTYLLLALAIAGVGLLIGVAGGVWLGRGLTEVYREFYHFPFLVLVHDPRTYVIAAGVTLVATLGGAARAIWSVARLSPAVAMAPAAPPRFTRSPIEAIARALDPSELTMMAVRRLVRWPLRTASTVVGLAFATALLICSWFTGDSVDAMVDQMFNRADRQSVTLVLNERRAETAMYAVAALPGVMRAESYRAVPVRLRNGPLSQLTEIIGKSPDARLSRTLSTDSTPVVLPPAGLAINQGLARKLRLKAGDAVEIELLEGRRRTLDGRVARVINGNLGWTAFMDPGALRRLLDEGPTVSGAYVQLDPARRDAFFTAVRAAPQFASAQTRETILGNLRKTIGHSLWIATLVYAALSITIAVGVAYNAARVQLSESARELASLRVLGFTTGETASVLAIELGLQTAAAILIGWPLGYATALLILTALQTDLVRMPFVVTPAVLAQAALITVAAVAAVAVAMRRRIDRLDLVAVLKTRD